MLDGSSEFDMLSWRLVKNHRKALTIHYQCTAYEQIATCFKQFLLFQ